MLDITLSVCAHELIQKLCFLKFVNLENEYWCFVYYFSIFMLNRSSRKGTFGRY